MLTQIPQLYIAHDKDKGRAVYCAIDITKDSVIECCPVIFLTKKDTELIHRTTLFHYYFTWNEELGTSVIPLGYGCLYNHDGDPNAETEIDEPNNELIFKAIKDIPAGTEILINYWGVPGQSYEDGLAVEKLKYAN